MTQVKASMKASQSSQLPAVARSLPPYCNNCECERFFKVLAHISDDAAKVKCEVGGRSRTIREDDVQGEKGGRVSDEANAAGGKTGKAEKVKKPRNTDGLKAAAEKRKLLNAEKKADAAARKQADEKATYQKQYETLKTQIGTSKVQPYGMKSKFDVADAIQHSKYGLGFVTMATGDRIEVAFETGVLPLVHNRA